jgi:hypothetical protein
MYTVFYKRYAESAELIFVSEIPTGLLAERIAEQLVMEFESVHTAWFEKDFRN